MAAIQSGLGTSKHNLTFCYRPSKLKSAGGTCVAPPTPDTEAAPTAGITTPDLGEPSQTAAGDASVSLRSEINGEIFCVIMFLVMVYGDRSTVTALDLVYQRLPMSNLFS